MNLLPRCPRIALLTPTALLLLLGAATVSAPTAEGAVVRKRVLEHQGRKRTYHC